MESKLGNTQIEKSAASRKIGNLVPPEIEQNQKTFQEKRLLDTGDFLRRSMKYKAFNFRRVSERFHLFYLVGYSFGSHSRTKITCLLPAQHLVARTTKNVR